MFCNGLHHARRACHVDLPHSFQVENTGLQGVNDECQMNHGHGFGIGKYLHQPSTACFLSQVKSMEFSHRSMGVVQLMEVHANDVPACQLVKQTASQIA